MTPLVSPELPLGSVVAVVPHRPSAPSRCVRVAVLLRPIAAIDLEPGMWLVQSLDPADSDRLSELVYLPGAIRAVMENGQEAEFRPDDRVLVTVGGPVGSAFDGDGLDSGELPVLTDA